MSRDNEERDDAVGVESVQKGHLQESPQPRKQDQLQTVAFAWKNFGQQLLIMQQLGEAHTGFPPSTTVQATPACLIPFGHEKPLKIATSGWRRSTGGAEGTLDGERWTDLVRRFSATAGFHLPWSIRDTAKSPERVVDNDGRYLACHAEKKLGLFFVTQQMIYAGVGLPGALQGRLRDAQLPPDRLRARIILGHRPCKNCRDFLSLIRRRMGIEIRTESGPVYTEHFRSRNFYDGPLRIEEDNGALPASAHVDSGDETQDEDVPENAVRRLDPLDGEGRDEDVEMDDAVDPLDEIEAALANAPVGNVRRAKDAVGKEEKEAKKNSQPSRVANAAPALPAVPLSVHSTPSPSLVSADFLIDSPTRDRQQRFPSHYSSPARARRGSSPAPPSIWGGRAKPPATPCFDEPDVILVEDKGRSRQAVLGGQRGKHPAARQPANEKSFFFGTPSAASSSQGGNANGRGGDKDTSAIVIDDDNGTKVNHDRAPSTGSSALFTNVRRQLWPRQNTRAAAGASAARDRLPAPFQARALQASPSIVAGRAGYGQAIVGNAVVRMDNTARPFHSRPTGAPAIVIDLTSDAQEAPDREVEPCSVQAASRGAAGRAPPPRQPPLSRRSRGGRPGMTLTQIRGRATKNTGMSSAAMAAAAARGTSSRARGSSRGGGSGGRVGKQTKKQAVKKTRMPDLSGFRYQCADMNGVV